MVLWWSAGACSDGFSFMPWSWQFTIIIHAGLHMGILHWRHYLCCISCSSSTGEPSHQIIFTHYDVNVWQPGIIPQMSHKLTAKWLTPTPWLNIVLWHRELKALPEPNSHIYHFSPAVTLHLWHWGNVMEFLVIFHQCQSCEWHYTLLNGDWGLLGLKGEIEDGLCSL